MKYVDGSSATVESIDRALDEAFVAAFEGQRERLTIKQRRDWLKVHGASHTVTLAAYMMGCSYDTARYGYKTAGIKPKNGWGKS